MIPGVLPAATEAPDFAVIVDEVGFESNTKTRTNALARVVKLEAGMGFESMEEFQTRLDREVQDLENLRVFSDVTVYFEDLQVATGAPRRVRVVFAVIDTWTLFPFLVPSSGGNSTSFVLGVVDKNFMGTLSEARLSGQLSIGTVPEDGSLEIPRWGIYLTFSGFTSKQWQLSTELGQTYETVRKYAGTNLVQDFSYYETLFTFTIRYEFRFVPKLSIYLVPMLGWRYGYETKIAFEPIDYEYFRTGIGFGIDYDRIDWIEFYRRGWAVGLINTIWGSQNVDSGAVKTVLTSRLAGFGIVGKVNPNFRILGALSLNHEMPRLGYYIRGVRADYVYGDRTIILNTGVQIQLWKAKVIELHMQPFVDIGLAAKHNKSLDLPEDFYMGIGSELILFFPKNPSVLVRGWFGFDPTVDGWSKEKWEIGLAFEMLY
jgi:outer membrane protein assembly factor BamA